MRATRAAFDGAIPLALLIAVPLLAPLVGIEIRDAIFAVPVIFLGLAAALATGGADRPGEREPALAWRLYALGAAVLAIAWIPALRDSAGAAGALVLTAGLLVHLRGRLRQGLRREALMEAAPGLIAAPVVTLLSAPPTVGVIAALVAFELAGLLSAGGRRRQDAWIGWRLWAMTTAVLGASALMGSEPEAAAALYAVAGWLLTAAAVAERPEGATTTPEDQPPAAAPAPAA